MCVYYESLCRDRCLQWSWVICLHYTTVAQPPRTIIYSDLPKHTHPETGSMLEAETLYTRPCLEHIMAFSGLSWCNPTPKQRTPQTKAISFTHAFFFHLQLCQHTCRNSCSSQLRASKLTLIPLLWAAVAGVLKRSRSLTQGQSDSLLQCSDVVMKRSEQLPYQFLQTEFWIPVNTVWHVLWGGSDMLDLWHKRSQGIYRLVSRAHLPGWKRLGGIDGRTLTNWWEYGLRLNVTGIKEFLSLLTAVPDPQRPDFA